MNEKEARELFAKRIVLPINFSNQTKKQLQAFGYLEALDKIKPLENLLEFVVNGGMNIVSMRLEIDNTLKRWRESK